jgi:hypothetical protein
MKILFVPVVMVFAFGFVARGATEDMSNVAELNQIVLYVPIPELEERFGEDAAGKLSAYIKTLLRGASKILSINEKPKAKGILIAVGIKSNGRAKVWCQAVDGDIPQKLLQQLERGLAKVEPVDLKKGPAGFGMEVNLYGEKPSTFPRFPDVWLEADSNRKVVIVPPDDLFGIIWPD